MSTTLRHRSSVESVESDMTVRFFNSGIRVSQSAERFARDPNDPWWQMPEPPALSRNLQIALLSLRKSDHSKQVLAALKAKGELPAVPVDYEALVPLGLAQRNRNGYHAITPLGHWRAGKIAHQIATELNLTLIEYRTPRRSGYTRLYGMSDSGNG